jgi:hypothetical protein
VQSSPDPVEYDPATHTLQAAELAEPAVESKADSEAYFKHLFLLKFFIDKC